MSTNPVAITIGIPVFNEEKNILSLLNQLKKQENNSNWKLDEVLVYCDGSTDRTPQLVKAFRWDKVKVMYDPRRQGKVCRLTQLFSDYKSDILVLVDADITLGSNDTINSLIEPFITNRKVKLVGAYSKVKKPDNFFQQAVYSSFLTFDTYRQAIKKGNNIFNCTGACLAIDRALTEKIKFPNMYINEDDFIYLSCIKNKFRFQFAPKAEVFYKLPATMKDYFKTRIRSNHELVRQEFKKYFGSTVRRETKVPKKLYLFSALKVITMYPAGFIFIWLTNIWISFFAPLFTHRYQLGWYSAQSTK